MRQIYLQLSDPDFHWLIPDFQFMLVAAIVGASLLTLLLWKQRMGETRTACDLLFWGIPGLLIGCKLFYFAQFGFPSTLPGWWRSEGLALYGGLFGLVAVWTACYIVRPFPALSFLDCAAPALAAGLFLGRIGCYLAGCNGGIPTDLVWGVSFPKGTAVYAHQLQAGLIAGGYERSQPVHPTQLYESLFGLIIAVLLWVLWRQGVRRGVVFFSGLLWYSIYRFATEPLRSDTGGLHPFGFLTFSQAISVIVGLAAVYFLVRTHAASTGHSRRHCRPLQ